MENASKALLIAAGIMVGVIVLSMIVYMHGKISNYYESKEQAVEGEQLAHFNKKYIGYNRDDVRGSELLSLINKILDYNDNVDDINYTNDQKIEISIIIPNNDKAKLFYYNYDKYNTTSAKLIKFGKSNKYTHEGESSVNKRIINPASNIEIHYGKELITKLASKMSTVMDENTKQPKEELFEELKLDYTTEAKKRKIQEDSLTYYQYIQFKRAHFNCTNVTYENGRIKSFEFKFNGTFE